MRDVPELLDAIDLVLARASGIVPTDVLKEAEQYASDIRKRRGFLGETLVLAVAGGTGTGKSSLVNALAGETITSVSVLRPHTDEPFAVIPQNPEPAVTVLLDTLGILYRHEHAGFTKTAIIDLPDVDSIADWHRERVEDLIPRVDGVIWLFDPDKYRDPIVHDEFLAQLAEHQSQFIFALNKIDRLRPDDLQTVREDLFETLAADGYPRPALFALAADPPSASPRGIELFREHVTERIDTKTVMLRKVIRDAAGIVRTIGEAAGVWEGVSVDFDKSWARVRTEVLAGVGSGSSQADREDALCRLEDLTALIAVKSGPLLGEEVRDVAARSTIEAIVDQLAEAGPAEPAPNPGLWGKLTGAEDDEVAVSPRADLLDSRLGDPLRGILWRRALLAATVTHASIGAVQLEDKIEAVAEPNPG
jgi:GTP-binding protein EngB required for normal cell division